MTHTTPSSPSRQGKGQKTTPQNSLNSGASSHPSSSLPSAHNCNNCSQRAVVHLTPLVLGGGGNGSATSTSGNDVTPLSPARTCASGGNSTQASSCSPRSMPSVRTYADLSEDWLEHPDTCHPRGHGVTSRGSDVVEPSPCGSCPVLSTTRPVMCSNMQCKSVTAPCAAAQGLHMRHGFNAKSRTVSSHITTVTPRGGVIAGHGTGGDAGSLPPSNTRQTRGTQSSTIKYAWRLYAVASRVGGATVHHVDKFTDLLDNWKWRNKLFKDVQYTGKLVLWFIERRGLESRYPELTKRLASVVQTLSLVRRFQVALQWMEDGVDLREAVQRRDWVSATLFCANLILDLCDDVVTLAKAKVFDRSKLHPGIERTAEVCWGIATVLELYRGVDKLRRANAAARAASIQYKLQRTGQSTSSNGGGVTGVAGSGVASDDGGVGIDAGSECGDDGCVGNDAVVNAGLKRQLAILSVCKTVADAGQSIPGAFGWDWYPDVADHLSGWTSGLLSTYQLWLKHDMS